MQFQLRNQMESFFFGYATSETCSNMHLNYKGYLMVSGLVYRGTKCRISRSFFTYQAEIFKTSSS